MSIKYKFANLEAVYFVTFAVVGWIDVFTRTVYKDLLLDSFRYCIKEKGLAVHGYVIMSNHVHMIISSKGKQDLSAIMRDMKKFSSVRLIREIIENPTESRKQWMLRLLSDAGKANGNNTHYQFWRQDNHPIELHPHLNIFAQKLNYIHQNPVKAGWVTDASAYIYSSASNYMEKGGVLMEVELLY
ncbi:Transposase IS200 like [Mucilaginibacter lappiensis]|uniref:REP element-mobilizing transposase RayT n=1 Tax=Mucilaginibacter lappiensis TaxID=354630 RepID=A0ABR6PEF0_9SPHI|nr:transposase [Mucilaginibacter lappiensis]MBB6108140.1 REP element-mobilizing transposase RayT [Mucilaginibacter lappiensis]SIQ50423.1 Transposase IS200 like [Mucilaginibacter lappiensis]